VLIATHDVGLMDRFPYRRLRFVDGRLVVGSTLGAGQR
jgi:ABC-type ATPase involved in cell division